MRVGWYVHHQGHGHLHRFLAVREELPGVVGLSSLPRPASVPHADWVPLPLDAPAGALSDPAAGGTLHWAPLRHPGLRERMARIAGWIDAWEPDAFVIDVSVEVALLARLLGIPTVVVAQRGVRDDGPHRAAYAGAAAVLAPWTRAAHLPEDGLPDGVRLLGALSRFDSRPTAAAQSGDVLVLRGAGGDDLDDLDVARAAAATPGRRWHVTGRTARVPVAAAVAAGPAGGRAGDVVEHGPDADVWALLQRSALVVGSAGNNVVAEVAAARRPLVCLPQPRPFREQERQAEALRRHDLAEVCAATPPPAAWPGLISRGLARDPDRWGLLHDGRAAARFAATVREIACA